VVAGVTLATTATLDVCRASAMSTVLRARCARSAVDSVHVNQTLTASTATSVLTDTTTSQTARVSPPIFTGRCCRDDCLEGKREDYQNWKIIRTVLCCIVYHIVLSYMHTHEQFTSYR